MQALRQVSLPKLPRSGCPLPSPDARPPGSSTAGRTRYLGCRVYSRVTASYLPTVSLAPLAVREPYTDLELSRQLLGWGLLPGTVRVTSALLRSARTHLPRSHAAVSQGTGYAVSNPSGLAPKCCRHGHEEVLPYCTPGAVTSLHPSPAAHLCFAVTHLPGVPAGLIGGLLHARASFLLDANIQ